jgi:hypothetical protein
MHPRRITFIAIETIRGIGTMPAKHQTIATDFGNDRCGTDGGNRLIPANDCFDLVSKWLVIGAEALVAVDADMRRRCRQAIHSASHRQQCGLKNIFLIDLDGGSERNRETDCSLPDQTRKNATLPGG